MDLTVYTFEDANGAADSWTTMEYDDAKRYAYQWNLRIIANTYEWSDSEPLEDYTQSDDSPEEQRFLQAMGS